MKCSNCSTSLEITDNFCPVCGHKQTSNTSENAVDVSSPVVSSNPEPLVRSKPKRVWPGLLVVFLIIVVIIIWANSKNVLNNADNQADSTSSDIIIEDPAPAPPWYPEGYEELTSNLAYQALPVEQMNCGYSSAHSCYQIYVVSNSACTAFVNVNFLVNGVIVDTGIDSASMTAGGQAIMSFPSFTAAQYEGDKKVQIIDASCY